MPIRCRGCDLFRFPDETFPGGYCPSCLDERSRKRRSATGARVLARAKDGGSLERDGETYRLVLLPPKGSRRRR
jgi:hypothetical protein